MNSINYKELITSKINKNEPIIYVLKGFSDITFQDFSEHRLLNLHPDDFF